MRSDATRPGPTIASPWRPFERHLGRSGACVIAGVDEVGRGALAGPVSAAACILPLDAEIDGLADSKRLTARRRVIMDGIIRATAEVSVAHVPAERIDAIGIAAATREAMRAAISGLGAEVQHVLVDGLPVDLGIASTAIVKGDGCVRSIAAASIVAKVARDSLMSELDVSHPGYGLGTNMGYGSAAHLEALRLHGPSPVHRRSFSPCSQLTIF